MTDPTADILDGPLLDGAEDRPVKVVVTGAAGFLGWHTRARLLALPRVEVRAIDRQRFSTHALEDAVAEADVVLHCAGINRGSDHELQHGNVQLAERLVTALESTVSVRFRTGRREPAVVFAGSSYADESHPGTDSAYAHGKREAGAVLLRWAEHAGGEASAADLRFTGLFGEHGRPGYNSFVANFAHAIAREEPVTISDDRELPLLHVGDAVERMMNAAVHRLHGVREQSGRPFLISEVAKTLERFQRVYAGTGEIPVLTHPYDVQFFNTFRAALWPDAYPIHATPRSDERGTLVEGVRMHGSPGQVFVSTTHPGYTRGNHYHLDKIERFLVLEGTARISLRKVLTTERLDFTVTGDQPAIIDMPTLWTHNITNIGDGPLMTMFWTNELFDPAHPDTWACAVDDGPDLRGVL